MVDIVGDTPTVTESDTPTVTHPDTPTLMKSDHILNKFNEPEAFVTQGMVNNIASAIILDSGAKRSVVSQNFIAHDSHPVGIETICGISQTPSIVQVHDVSVAMTGLNGTCRVAVETLLPPKTVLLHTDLGTDKLLELLNDIKTKPTTAFSITSTLNYHSHTLLVPAPLRRSVLIAAHDGLGHGGIGATRALINKQLYVGQHEERHY